MILFIVRHAWAGQFGDPQWPDDSLRSLTDQGRVRFGRVVGTLAERGFQPEVVATSPYVRCRQTAAVIAEVLPGHPPVVAREELEPAGGPTGLLEWTIAQSARYEQVAWVGHAPDVGHLAAALIGDTSAEIRFAKGAVAAIEFDDAPEFGEGELRWLATAKILGC